MRANLSRAAIAVLAAVSAAALLSACGSSGDDEQDSATSYQAGATETSDRPDRQSSVVASQQDSTVDDETETEAEPDDAALGTEVLSRHREGLPGNRNVIGDPDAPITIIEYGDFQ